MNSKRLATLLGVACLPLALTACQPDGAVRVLNHTSETLTIQVLTADGEASDVEMLAPGGGTSLQPRYQDADKECTKNAHFQAVDTQGVVVSKLTAICAKDEWVIDN